MRIAQLFPFAILGILYYGVLFFCIWLFYPMLSKINDNLAAIHRAIGRSDVQRSERQAGSVDGLAGESNPVS
jgi:hypothetical protein